MKNSKRVKIENNKLSSFSIRTGQSFIWENNDSVAIEKKVLSKLVIYYISTLSGC